MPRRNRRLGYGTNPGRLIPLEEELHAIWDRRHAARLARQEQEATRKRFAQLERKLTR